MNNKIIIIILIVFIGVVSVYVIFSGSKSHAEIKRLTKELQVSTDSLKSIHQRYQAISCKYDTIYLNFTTTRDHFVLFQHRTDSLLHSTKNDVEKIHQTMKLVLKEQEYIKKISETKISPIFN